MSYLAVGGLGGTITMAKNAENQGASDFRLSAEELIAAVPAIPKNIDIKAETILKMPSPSLSFSDLMTVLHWCHQQVEQGAHGIVITQGSDSLEETAFWLDLYWTSDIPIAITAAMRVPKAVSADGPANIYAAVLTVLSPESRGRGVLAVLNNTIHAAKWVMKGHSLAVDAFQSVNGGAIGYIAENRVCFLNHTTRVTLPQPVCFDHQVALLSSSLGADSALIYAAAELPQVKGIVIAAFGAGHVSENDADAVSRYSGKLPIVIATRCGQGTTAQETYAYKGSEMDLMQRGAIMAGWLSPIKARILLWASIASNLTEEERRALFNQFH